MVYNTTFRFSFMLQNVFLGRQKMAVMIFQVRQLLKGEELKECCMMSSLDMIDLILYSLPKLGL